MGLCNPILFILYMLLFPIPILRCSAQDCCLEEGHVVIASTVNKILVCPVFELGFFTPDGSNSDTMFLGIWYSTLPDPKIIVWVANRDKPMLESDVSLVVERGKAQLLDGKGQVYWSTANSTFHSSTNFTELCLHDTGNLILADRRLTRVQRTLWQSFDHPTDTFLPKMIPDGSLGLSATGLNLTSWRNFNNPAQGNFTFPLRPSPSNDLAIYELQNYYWRSGTTPLDQIPPPLSVLWFGNGINPLPNGTRLVMNYTGQIQFWEWQSEGWLLNWSEPKDGCSLYGKCGNFGSCNSKNGLLCKCLPGFKPSEKWNSGDTAGGCSQISGFHCDVDNSNVTFLTLHMMKVGNKTCTVVPTEENCDAQCRNNCYCVAYSNGSVDCSGTSSTKTRCLQWTELTDLQEESPNGITIYVRTTQSDIDPTLRGCRSCGTYIIPYPLSTGRNCGDPSTYFNFHCNNETGQVNFSTSSGNFRVISINPDARTFSIQAMHSSCDDKYIDLLVLSLKNSSSFTFKNCNVIKDRPLIQFVQPFINVEIGWLPPREFVCHASSDCNHWPHTTCKTTKEGTKRCLCGSKFIWNCTSWECARAPFPVKVAVPCIVGALVIILVSTVFIGYHLRKRRLVEERGSLEFKEDDTEGMDVAFIHWENILAATNNFADANRLGTGGFGSVYMGRLPDGQEIAVKRLSSVSVQGVEEFRTEVVLIAKLQHRNLVRLIGYCMKADEKILVYEYLPNGSLDSCLFDERHSVRLDWKKRFDIILGIARGLLYLHQDSRLRIIHRDLKPSNILLDEELNPKISDFGIARIVGGKETQASTGRVVGTYGYMSPEYAYEGIFSVKSDVFSFGIVMLETITGRRNSRTFVIEHGLSLPGHAYKLWKEDRGLELMDLTLNKCCSPSEVMKCIHIGLLCVQEDPSDRPIMSTVVQMLSSENGSLPLAKQPAAFIYRKPLSDMASSSSAKDSSVHENDTVGR